MVGGQSKTARAQKSGATEVDNSQRNTDGARNLGSSVVSVRYLAKFLKKYAYIIIPLASHDLLPSFISRVLKLTATLANHREFPNIRIEFITS